MQRFVSSLQTADDKNLFVQRWEVPKPRAQFLIVHGMGEHSDCYESFAHFLGPLGIQIATFDLRGHGRSQGHRGCVDHFSQLEQDLELFIRSQKSDLPTILFGHSMGGLICLKTVLNLQFGSNQALLPKALVLGSPFLGLSLAVPKWKLVGAHFLDVVAPNFTLADEISEDMISRDPEFLKEHAKDPLRHHQMSSRWFLGAMDAIEWTQSRAQNLATPLLLQVPRRDPVVSSSACLSFFERCGSKSKTLRIYEDRKHEIYNDIGKEEAIRDLQEFLSTIIGK